jgi:release factor glutamine methyltransferase
LKITEALRIAQDTLTAASVNSVRLDSELLLCHVLGHDRSWLLAHDQDELLPEQLEAYNALIHKRAQHVPVVHLTNTREFYGIDLYIDDTVLTPRVETEQMVELAIKHTPKGGRLIDIGTGSGAIAIAIATHRPDLKVWATEYSPEALKVARKNITANNLNIILKQADLFEGISEKFDVVVCNLPYLADDADLMPEVQKEPGVALFGGPDGLDIYRRFLAQLPSHLKPGGMLFTECDPWQQAALIAEAKTIGLECIEEDYFILGFRLR